MSSFNFSFFFLSFFVVSIVYSAETEIPTKEFLRYWNAGISDHFYTTNINELGAFGRGGWKREGTEGYLATETKEGLGLVVLYRYWNPTIGDHFYTTNYKELGEGKNGWKREGNAGYCSPKLQCNIGAITPLYRYWNSKSGDHFYTTNLGELTGGKGGYILEGIQCYVFNE